MTRKHYIAIASAIKSQVDRNHVGAKSVIEDVAREIATEMKNDNHRFDRERFLTACGF